MNKKKGNSKVEMTKGIKQQERCLVKSTKKRHKERGRAVEASRIRKLQ
jgi:hypothetical protein